VKARIQRLRAEIQNDRLVLHNRQDELVGLDLSPSAPPGDLARAAVALHHAYGAVESIMVRTARELAQMETG
jgi:hypothetical protein